jgi:hypothetical protein
MKVVHITRLSGADSALCSHKVDYGSSIEKDKEEGWCVVDYMKTYRISSLYARGPWEFCEECLTSSDYGLFLLGELP